MNRPSCKTIFAGFALGLAFASPVLAGDISISGQVAHIEDQGADHGGLTIEIFMTVENAGAADRLYAVRSKAAKSGQMAGAVDKRDVGHGHAEHLAATVLDIPANGRLEMTEEGRHLELNGLKKKVAEGDVIQVTLFFEKAGRVKIDVPVKAESH